MRMGRNKSVFSLLRQLPTWHCPHLLQSAICCWAPAPAARRDCNKRPLCINRSTSPVRRALSSNPAAAALDRRGRHTDGRTDARPFNRPCSACYAGSISKQKTVTKYRKHYSDTYLMSKFLFIVCRMINIYRTSSHFASAGCTWGWHYSAGTWSLPIVTSLLAVFDDR